MIIIVNDASILIDLLKPDLSDDFFVLLLICIQKPHGILWIFNHLISAGEISMEDTKAKFTELMEINVRLSRNECYKKLKK